ncbi:MAG: hypothetical protein IKJ59_14280, partial [Clostridia bacterium]|nr:hypothetical protein [Clostridia bacterium]
RKFMETPLLSRTTETRCRYSSLDSVAYITAPPCSIQAITSGLIFFLTKVLFYLRVKNTLSSNSLDKISAKPP